MIYNALGTSGLSISRIGFGCMSLKPETTGKEFLIHSAIENGINFFDTADLYDKGENEIMLGKALKGKRNKVILATKAGNQWRKDGSGWDWNPSPEYIISVAEASLKRLQTDHIDLFQLHGGTIDDPIPEIIQAFELLVKQGKIRYYGISSIRPNVIREWVANSNLTSVMMQYSLLDRRPEETCLPLLHQNKIGVLSRGSLAQGLLIDKTATGYLGYQPNEVARLSAAIEKITGKEKKTHAAIEFVLSHPALTSAVVGMRTPSQLQAVLQVISNPVLSADSIGQLKEILPVNRYSDHR